MSNCCEVKNDVVFLKEHCQNIDGFLNFLETTNRLSSKEMEAMSGVYTGQPMSDDQQALYVGWWWLTGAVTPWTSPDNNQTGLLWTPGDGCRSTHTFRDLEGTLRVLGKKLILPGLGLCTPLDLVDTDDGDRNLGWRDWDYRRQGFYKSARLQAPKVAS